MDYIKCTQHWQHGKLGFLKVRKNETYQTWNNSRQDIGIDVVQDLSVILSTNYKGKCSNFLIKDQPYYSNPTILLKVGRVKKCTFHLTQTRKKVENQTRWLLKNDNILSFSKSSDQKRMSFIKYYPSKQLLEILISREK